MTDYETFVKTFDSENPEFVNPDGTHKLSCNWVLWSHAHDVRGYKLEDYEKHCVIRTVEDFWNVFNGLPSLINKDMWFLMREGIPPRWEDPINAEGGSFKFRVPGNKIDNAWLTLALRLVTENMCLDPDDANLISGIAVSPKKHNFCTLSVWNLDCRRTEYSKFPRNIEGIDFTMSLYQAHKHREFG